MALHRAVPEKFPPGEATLPDQLQVTSQCDVEAWLILVDIL